MLPDLQSAIHLQQIDDRAAALTREISTLPKHLAEIEKRLASHERRLDLDRAALAANQKERRQIEVNNQGFEQKISKLRDQMLSAKTNEQYRAFQNEIDYAQNEIRKGEDRILDLMGEAEPLDRNVKAAELSLREERNLVDAEKAEAQKRTAANQAELALLKEEKAGIARRMSPGNFSTYERIRKNRTPAIAEAAGGRCAACHVSLRPQFLQELKRGEIMMTCESCARLLYYNPPESLDQSVPEAGAISC